MRNPIRIKYVIKKLIKNWLDKKLARRIEKKWEKNPDQRLFQLLLNFFTDLEYVTVLLIVTDDKPDENMDYYYYEEIDYLAPKEYPWVSVMNKDWEVYEEPKEMQLGDLPYDHLEAILDSQVLWPKYTKWIKEILWEMKRELGEK